MITLALIGVGVWGKNYLATVKKIPGVRIIFIVALHREKLAQYTKEYQTMIHYQELLGRKELDGVIIATPPSTHYRIAKEFLQSGKHVLIEKPVSQKEGEIEILLRVAKKNKLVAMVGHEYVYNKAFLKVRELISRIGTLSYISAVDGKYGPFRDDISPLWDWSPHMISMLLSIFKKQPVSLSAYGQQDQKKSNYWIVSQCVFVFENNTPVFLRVGSLEIPKKRTMTIVGQKGVVVFDDLATEKAVLYLYQEQAVKEIVNRYNNELPLVSQLKHFIDCIQEKKSPITDMQHAKEITRIIVSCEESMKYGGKKVVLQKQ